jgi:hypothetical protein
MRRRNWRVVIAGVLLLVMAVVFYNTLSTVAPQSTDPIEMMGIAGSISGTAIGISVVMMLIGLIGKRA